MERKYRGQKKTIMVLCIVGILLIAIVIFCQIRLKSAKPNAEEFWAKEMVELNQKVADAQAEYESKGYEATEDELKAQSKELKSFSKDMVKAYEKDDAEALATVIAEYEAYLAGETEE